MTERSGKDIDEDPGPHGQRSPPASDPDERVDELFWRSRVPYRDLIEQVKDYAVFCTDARGRATTWNLGVERVLGFAEREFIGIDIATGIFTPEDIEAGVPQWEMEEAALRGSANDNRWMRKKDGTHFFCLGMTTALRDDAGRLIGFAKIMQDRTAQHEQAEQLRETTARLSFANQQKDRFLAVLSHELRNPLAPIRNAVYVLRIASADSAPGRRAVDAIDRQSAHLKHLVDDLLDIARIGQGKIGLRMEQVELSGFVTSVAEDHREVFEQSAIELDTKRRDEPLYVHADRTRLTQIVGNLLDNARKFTPRGGRVTLGAERYGDEARVTVSDTGAGMTPEVLATVFEPFVQAEATIARSIGGLGLGLALVKGLVELHGGRIEAHSLGPEQGADVIVYLPLRAPEEEPQSVEPTEEALGGACRVLIIEDNADAADMLKTALVMRGHQVRAANTGQRGLEMAAEFRPEVILCDIGLPDLDGYEIARRVRADPAHSRVQLVALTGRALPEDVERAEQAGFDKHVAKPPDLDSLDELISSRRK